MRFFVLSDYLQDNGEEWYQECCHEKWDDLDSISDYVENFLLLCLPYLCCP